MMGQKVRRRPAQMEGDGRHIASEHVKQAQERRPAVRDDQAVQGRIACMCAEPHSKPLVSWVELWAEGRRDQRQIGEQLDDLGYRTCTDQRKAQRAKGRQLSLLGEREAERSCLVDIECGVHLAKPPYRGLDVPLDQRRLVDSFASHDVAKPRDSV